ncbi:hypothetical protein C8A00DRAFT_35445 [Chaetomidium leptoderma]|uniref:Uncharacterized protein n=1 Tax=Chaetomidium leptoderma TaxID=669021 RepID=A0AAN6VK55_9PEZI|nr:hypothetical protein C8A00DRAFT_35445 [Chaetomidium leptoderma]
MTDTLKQDQGCSDSESEPDGQPGPSREKTAAFIGYRAFPPVMNLYVNYSGIFSALTTLKLCGASQNDFIYLVQLHVGYTSRGPLNFGRGYYLHNGTTTKDPVLAAAGDEFTVSYLAKVFDPTGIVLLPPLDMTKNPQDMITETIHSSATKEQGVSFRFAVEVGVKKWRRESFDNSPGGGVSSSSSTSPASPAQADESTQIVAELVFDSVLSIKHIFNLEIKGAGLRGELGERWALMVVMTALSLYYQRQTGRTKKATVMAAGKMHGKKAGGEVSGA